MENILQQHNGIIYDVLARGLEHARATWTITVDQPLNEDSLNNLRDRITAIFAMDEVLQRNQPVRGTVVEDGKFVMLWIE